MIQLIRGMFIASSFCFLGNLVATPPREIDPALRDAFTLNNQIPVIDWYLDQSQTSNEALVWEKKHVDECIQKVLERSTLNYPATDLFIYKILERRSIEGKKVLIIGSETPAYEAVVLAFKGHPVTVEYRRIKTDDDRLTTYTVEEFEDVEEKFDAILSISSIEHDGLGRYGDPVNPNGDLAFMEKAKGYLKDGGLFFLAVPTGRDCLVWNAHRIYGPKRLSLLLTGWDVIDTEGFVKKDFYRSLGFYAHQPVLCLKRNAAVSEKINIFSGLKSHR